MGTSAIAFRSLCRSLGYEPVQPNPPTQRTLSLGTRYSPEFACIPFKIVLGTYIEVLERGAELLVSGGGKGPCRAGYYGELHQRILNDIGYDCEMVFFWPPLRTPADFLRKVRRFKGGASWTDLYRALRLTWEKLLVLDDLEMKSHRLRPLQRRRGSVTAALESSLDLVDRAVTVDQVREARRMGLARLENVPVHDSEPDDLLKVGVVGEIYVQLEPFANFNLEEKLGDLGVFVKRGLFLTDFARTDILRWGDEAIADVARPYLSENVGGHGQNSIGEIIEYARRGYDGVVQLAPFSCIPEIVAKSIVPALSREWNIPVMTLFIDEQTGRGGVETRLEAFVDLLRSRRRKDEGKAHARISGS